MQQEDASPSGPVPLHAVGSPASLAGPHDGVPSPSCGDVGRGRSFCFTLFAQERLCETDCDSLRALGKSSDVRYLVFGRELCPTTGRQHLQGYIQFRNARRFNAVRGILPAGSHIELAKGTPSQNRKYCVKDGDYEEFGTTPSAANSGRKLDERLAAVFTALQDGESHMELAREQPGLYVRFHAGIMRTAEILRSNPRTDRPTVYWFYGPTGSGKSRAVYDRFPGAFFKPPGQWWDGYDHQPVVCLDDFRPEDFPYHYLLRLLDYYPLLVQVKGGFRQFNSGIVCVTCPCRPSDLYVGLSEDVTQLERRVTKCVSFPVSVSDIWTI